MARSATTIDRLLNDKVVHENLRRIGESATVAVQRLKGPEKPPPKRFGRRLVLALAAGAAAATAANRGMRAT